jgi:hypothetical protein
MCAPPRFADAEARDAYRDLERTLSVGFEAVADAPLASLVRATLHAYAGALDESALEPDLEAWATFVHCAATLRAALDTRAEGAAGLRWRRAAQTLEQIVSENADLIPPDGGASRQRASAHA